MTFVYYYNKDAPNPNELTGAIVGGPDKNDDFNDKRTQSSMTEPTTYTNSLAVGVLTKLARQRSNRLELENEIQKGHDDSGMRTENPASPEGSKVLVHVSSRWGVVQGLSSPSRSFEDNPRDGHFPGDNTPNS
ncbi:hypothetical protein LguiB_028119 [Lonicera macranthoides]